jgi:hypothetical protein
VKRRKLKIKYFVEFHPRVGEARQLLLS